MLLIFLKKQSFHLGNVFKTKQESEENKFFEHIENKTKDIDHDLFRNILILKHLLS